MKQIDAFVALSGAIRDIYVSNGFGDCRIEHVPNMIDPSFEVPPSDERTSGAYGEKTEVLYVGELATIKGVEYLVRAIKKLPATYRLHIAGSGDTAEDLEALVTDLGIADRVEFKGWVPYQEVPKLYAKADVFVHPGVWPEPLNRTVFEAMQAELPVVCTNIGGPPEVIPDKELLCPPGDPAALAHRIRLAARDAAKTGAQNRDHAESNYAPGVVLPRLLALYDDLRDT
jgi:glycosyltransferase involved in cell wall biosynthesis